MSNDSSQEKNEQPTERKLERTRDEGQVAYSADLTNGVSLLLTTLLFALVSDQFLESLLKEIVELILGIGVDFSEDQDWQSMLSHSTMQVMLLCLPVLMISFFATLLPGGLLSGFRLSPKALKIDFQKLDPVKGVAKLFSSRSVVRGVMSIIKFAVISAIVFLVLRQQYLQTGWNMSGTIGESVESIVDLVIIMLIGVSSGLLILGVVDFVFQKWKHIEDLKMSRQELIDERKDDEGDPHVRARLKRLQREMSQRRMLQDVSSATVVITNPTHFAVALKYERSGMSAPVVVAKGQDHLALKIIEIAKAHNVAVVERKPLARALYDNVPVGGEIPLDLYQTVAEVLSYIHSVGRQVY